MEQILDYDHLSIANFMHNLVDFTVEDCRGLKYLFSYSAIGSLSKLEHLEISRCEMMEEIIAPKAKNNVALEEVRFSKLETLVVKDMKRLKNVWHFQFESLKTLEVSNCAKLANIFPFELQGITFGSLETLKADKVVDTPKQEITNLLSSSDDRQQKEDVSSTYPQDAVSQNVPSSSSNMIPDAATMYLSPSQAPELATAQSTEGSRESNTCPRENLFNTCPKVIVTCDNNEAVGSQEIRETMDKPLIQSDQHAQKLATTENTEELHDSSIGTQEIYDTIKKPSISVAQNVSSSNSTMIPDTDIHDTMDKPLIQTDQGAEKLATIQNTEESRDSYAGTQKICDTIKKASISAAQDASNSTMNPEAAIDPLPLQAPEPVISPTEKLNIYRNYKGMIDILEQNMPHLEAGVNRHPQVLDWLNTKRRRVFASSTFSLFAEECGDAEDIKRKVEETKGQASSLEAQIESMKEELAYVKESLVLLLDKARNLDD
ncbi:hypothetical protein K1719_016819 [Acacia pycnantha]|nr:hypothetical protein K1719_016819 [Acacia pycnantha]